MGWYTTAEMYNQYRSSLQVTVSFAMIFWWLIQKPVLLSAYSHPGD